MDYLQQLYAKLSSYVVGGVGSGCSSTPRKIVAFGNVLLDRTADLPENEVGLLERYNIPLNSTGELDAETLAQITAEASERVKCVINPGGSALNTVRIMKQLGTDALFFGAVGEDKSAEELRDILKQHGVDARLATVNDAPTGQCICLVHRDNKTLYANIGASAKFDVDHLKQAERDNVQPFLRPVERKQILYIEGFFVPHREHVCDFIMKNYIQERRRLAVNLSAPYIVEQNFEQMVKLVRTAFFVFGNNKEYETLTQLMGCESVEELAKRMVQESGKPKVFLVTMGHRGVLLMSNCVGEHAEPGELIFETYNTPRVGNVVDRTGAGDAFVGAFMHAWLEKRPLSECVRMGTDVASKVVTQVGCHLPQEVSFSSYW